MISIDSGRYGDVDLAGVQFLVTFNMGTWSKIYVSDKVSPAQEKAVEALLPLAFAGFHKGMLSFSKVPITMEVTDARVRFTAPESSVDMEVVRGYNGQADQDPEPAGRGDAELHPVQERVAPALECAALLEALRHQRLRLDDDRGQQVTLSGPAASGGSPPSPARLPAPPRRRGRLRAAGAYYLAYRAASTGQTVDELAVDEQGRRDEIAKETPPATARPQVEAADGDGAELHVEGVGEVERGAGRAGCSCADSGWRLGASSRGLLAAAVRAPACCRRTR